MTTEFIYSMGKKVLEGGELSQKEALQLMQVKGTDIPLLASMANKVREKYTGNQVDLCSIVNARSGSCTEDCAFCAQSAHHEVKLKIYPLMPVEEIVTAAKVAEKAGAHRFCIVTAGKGMNEDKDFPNILKAIERIGRETGLKRCCSLGTLNMEQALALKKAGITRYHHNLETSSSFFPNICTTHTFEERVQTVKIVKEAGLESCCGGIIGLGESPEQRVELAFTLKELKVDSVPVNVLSPVPGTRLANALPLDPMEIIKTIAVFRLILPKAIIRYAGGRELNLRELQSYGLLSGVNGMLVGNYLTCKGRNAEEDLMMLKDLGLNY